MKRHMPFFLLFLLGVGATVYSIAGRNRQNDSAQTTPQIELNAQARSKKVKLGLLNQFYDQAFNIVKLPAKINAFITLYRIDKNEEKMLIEYYYSIENISPETM